MFGLPDDPPAGGDAFADVEWEEEPPAEWKNGAVPEITAAVAAAGKARAELAVPQPSKARTGDSKRKSLAEIKALCPVQELTDALKEKDTSMCSQVAGACPNRKCCCALLATTLCLATITLREAAFTGPYQPGEAGAMLARGQLAFDILKAAHRGDGNFKFMISDTEVCEGVARWVRGFHFGNQWDGQKKRVLAGMKEAYDAKGESSSGLGKRARAGKGGMSPAERTYKAGHAHAWLENLAVSIGDHMPGGDQRNVDVLVLPFRRWIDVHRLYNQACEHTPGFGGYQVSCALRIACACARDLRFGV